MKMLQVRCKLLCMEKSFIFRSWLFVFRISYILYLHFVFWIFNFIFRSSLFILHVTLNNNKQINQISLFNSLHFIFRLLYISIVWRFTPCYLLRAAHALLPKSEPVAKNTIMVPPENCWTAKRL